MNQNVEQLSPQERERKEKEWTQTSYSKALRHLTNLGLTQIGVMQSESRILPPLLAVWRLHGKLDGGNTEMWVVTGDDVPVDHVSAKTAKNAREAMRHFMMSFQLKAARLEQGLADKKYEVGNEAMQTEYVKSVMVNTPQLWPEFQNA